MEETTHIRTVELLPWLINGTLDSGERRQVEDHLRTCASCRDELAATRHAFDLYGAHLPTAVLAGYAEAPEARVFLDGEHLLERDRVEDHLQHCAPCRRELEMARDSLARLREGDDAEEDPGPWATVTPFTRPVPAVAGEAMVGDAAFTAPRWLPMALAASVILAVLGTGGWFSAVLRADARDQAQQQRIARLEEDLRAERQRAAEQPAATGAEEELAAYRQQTARRLQELEARAIEAEDLVASRDLRIDELSAGVPAAGVAYVPLMGGDVVRSGSATRGDGGAPLVELSGRGGVLLQPEVRPDVLAGDARLTFRVLDAAGEVVAEGALPVLDETDKSLGRYVSLYLPAGVLPAGELSLEIDAGGEEVGRYRFRVRR